jgi:hypothetical protein
MKNDRLVAVMDVALAEYSDSDTQSEKSEMEEEVLVDESESEDEVLCKTLVKQKRWLKAARSCEACGCLTTTELERVTCCNRRICRRCVSTKCSIRAMSFLCRKVCVMCFANQVHASSTGPYSFVDSIYSDLGESNSLRGRATMVDREWREVGASPPCAIARASRINLEEADV